MLRPLLLLAALSAPVPAGAAALAQAARVQVGPASIAVGAKLPAAAALVCKDSSVQHTVRKCTLKPAALASTRALGSPVASVTLVEHYQGDVVNMAVSFEPGMTADSLRGVLETSIGSEPKIEYWADDDHLYASYIWVDGETEVELTDTIKGAKPAGGVTVYVSSLTRNRPLNPADAL